MRDKIKLRKATNKYKIKISKNIDKNETNNDNINTYKNEENDLKYTTNYNELIVNHIILYNNLN
jgi:hypothetical protein